MNSLIGFSKLFLWNSRIKLQSVMQYRFDFIAGIFISLFASCVGPLFQYFIFTQTKGYPGWNVRQIVLFQGILLTYVGIRDMIYAGVRGQMMGIVRKGDFDRYLLKPFQPIVLILAGGFSLNSIGTLLMGLTIMVYSISVMGLSISILQIILFFLCLMGGLIFYSSFVVLNCAILIMTVNSGRIWDVFDSILKFAEYPAEIFPKATRVAFMTVVPFMVIAYFPTQVLLDRIDVKLFYALAVSVVFLLASLGIWNKCLKRYTSAGG